MTSLSSAAVSACTCNSLGASKELRLCTEHHRYWVSDRRLASVSSVTESVLPTDWTKIPRDVLDNAKDRGVTVDAWFCEYLRTGTVNLPVPRVKDREEYLERLIAWWNKSGLEADTIQEAVFSLDDGVAGTLDFRCGDTIVDLKCVASLRPAYELQLGSYVHYHPDAKVRKAAILHVTKTGVKLVPYDAHRAVERWKTAVSWWRVKQQLAPSDDAPESWI